MVSKKVEKYDHQLEMMKLDFMRLVRRYKNTRGAILEYKMYGLDGGQYYQSLRERRATLKQEIENESKELHSLAPSFIKRLEL